MAPSAGSCGWRRRVNQSQAQPTHDEQPVHLRKLTIGNDRGDTHQTRGRMLLVVRLSAPGPSTSQPDSREGARHFGRQKKTGSSHGFLPDPAS